MRKFLILLLLLVMVAGTGLAVEGSLSKAVDRAANEAGDTTTRLVYSIDLEEFSTHFGLTLSDDDEALVRIALMAYSNGAMLEHPVGIDPFTRVSLPEDPYVGNKKSKKFHYSWCSSVSDIKEGNKVTFNSVQEALDKGYKPCKKCNPGTEE